MRTSLATILPAVALFATTGCTVYSSDTVSNAPPPAPPPPAVVYNALPWVSASEAGVYYDGYYREDIWYFETFTGDPDGVYDVVEVWADVYDEYWNGAYVTSFELFPTDDPSFWFSDWLGGSTGLDPFYDGYTVDFVAYDSFGDSAYETVWAVTY